MNGLLLNETKTQLMTFGHQHIENKVNKIRFLGYYPKEGPNTFMEILNTAYL